MASLFVKFSYLQEPMLFFNRKLRLAGNQTLYLGAALVAPQFSSQSDRSKKKNSKRRQPKQGGLSFEPRPQQHKLAIAFNQVIDDLLIRPTGFQLLAHQETQVAGERRRQIINGLVLTNQTAKIFRDVASSRFERRVRQDLIRLNSARAAGQKQEDQD